MSAGKAMGPAEWSMLAALPILWGGSFLFIGVAVTALPLFTIVALRVGLAALALLAATRMMGLLLPSDRRVWAAFFGMGLLNNVVPFSLIVWGQTQIGLASILNATTPLFAAIVAHVLTVDEKLTANKLTGVVIRFFGVATMIGPSALFGASAPRSLTLSRASSGGGSKGWA